MKKLQSGKYTHYLLRTAFLASSATLVASIFVPRDAFAFPPLQPPPPITQSLPPSPGKSPLVSTPEPSLILGFITLGGLMLGSRKKEKA